MKWVENKNHSGGVTKKGKLSLRNCVADFVLIFCLFILLLLPSVKAQDSLVVIEAEPIEELYVGESFTNGSSSLSGQPYIGCYAANESLAGGPVRGPEASGVRVTVSFYGTDITVIQSDNFLDAGIAARGQDSYYQFPHSVDWGYLYALQLRPSMSPNPILRIAVLSFMSG